MFPKPISEWTREGWMSANAPSAKVIQMSATQEHHNRLKGFIFKGPGWYPEHKVLVTSVGIHENEERFELRFYYTDPRPVLYALGMLKTKENSKTPWSWLAGLFKR